MTELIMEAERTTPRAVAGVRFHKVGKVYHFNYDAFPDLQVHDWVVVETARGRQMGEVTNFAAPQADHPEYRTIQRRATPRDLVLKQYWDGKAPEALELCQQRAKAMQLNGIKFISALYSFDGSLLTFLYTAEDRASSINPLWQELNRHFPAQIELRVIGPRDVAKLLGGFGACGELRCCSTFLTDFSPVSIKMAKAQGISLNPSEITGMCGRLRCCLVYEYEQYVAARAQLPKRNKRIGTPHGEGKVLDVLPMQDAVIVAVADGVHTVKREDLIPLEEFEALAKKAGEPCTKHGDGPCECGAKPGKAAESAVGDAPAATNDTTLRADAPSAALPRRESRDMRGRESRGRTERPQAEAGRTERGRTERREDRPQSGARAEGRADTGRNEPRREGRSAPNERGQHSETSKQRTPDAKRRDANVKPDSKQPPKQDAPSRGGNPSSNQPAAKKARRGGKNRQRDPRQAQGGTPRPDGDTPTPREQTPRSEQGDGSSDGG
jgi:cell fate regulator YaaT (PSP1 superfamily)